MQIIDKGAYRTAFIVEKKKLVGIVTDGDIRRAIMKGHPLEDTVDSIMTKNPLVIRSELSGNELIKLLLNYGILIIPVVNDHKEIIGVKSLVEEVGKLIDLEPKLDILKQIKNKDQKNPRILIIGGAGFIGSIVSMHLAKQGYFIRILDLFYHGMDSFDVLSNIDNVEIYKGDMRKSKILELAMQDIDYVIHLGAIVGDPACESNPDLALESNFFATQ